MIGAAIRKETLQLLADRGALASLFLMPLAFVTFFGLVFRGGGEDRARELAVWHAADDARGAAIVEVIRASEQFAAIPMDDPDAVRAAVADEQVRVGLIIPPDFAPRAGRPAELVIDAAESAQFRGPVEGALHGLLARATLDPSIAAQLAGPFVEVRSPPGVKPPLGEVDSFQLTVPGNALLFGFFIAVTVGLSFVEERRRGTFRRLLAAPVGRPTVLLAKLVPYFLVGLVQMAFLFGVGAAAFGMRVAGSPIALAAVSMAAVFCAVSLGLLIASFGGSEKKVGGFASLAVLIMGLLGGAMVPRLLMPDIVQTLGLAVPHGWALDAYYDVLIREGTTVADIWRPLAVLWGFGVLFAGIGATRFRFE